MAAFVCVGSYTQDTSFADGRGKGLVVIRVEADGRMEHVQTAPVAHPNPTYMTGTATHIFATSEVYGGNGVVDTYEVDASSHSLRHVSSVDCKGTGCCHLDVDRSGTFVPCANYMSGSLICFRNDNGRLTETDFHQFSEFSNVDPGRQEAAHAHQALLDPAQRNVYVPDLGADKVLHFAIE